MGLTEKRLIKRLTDEVIGLREAELHEIAGSPIRYEIDWTYFMNKAAAIEGLEQWGFDTIAAAFRLICRDEIGREAVAAQIKTIQISDWNASWPTGTVGGGALSLLWDWGGSERFSAAMLEEHVSTQL